MRAIGAGVRVGRHVEKEVLDLGPLLAVSHVATADNRRVVNDEQQVRRTICHAIVTSADRAYRFMHYIHTYYTGMFPVGTPALGH